MNNPESKSGDRAAGEPFKAFIEQHYPAAYRFAFCLTLSHERANDLTERVFARADAAQQNQASAETARRWLLQSLYRDATERRLADCAAPSTEPLPANAELIGSIAAEKLEPDVVLKTLHAMRCERRLILSLFYLEGLGHADIERVLNISSENAFARLAEAKTAFRQRLEQQSSLPSTTRDTDSSGPESPPRG